MSPGEPLAPPPPTPPAVRPRRRLLRKALWGLLGLAIVLAALIAFLPAILSSTFGKERILGVARGRIEAPVDAAGFSFSWTGSQRIDGLRIGSPPGFDASEDVLRAESIVIQGGLLGLIFSGREVAVDVRKPVLNVRRRQDGAINLEALRPRAEKAGAPRDEDPEPRPRDERPAPPREGTPAFPRQVEARVEGGTITYRDDALGAASDITEIEAALSAGGEEISLRSSARISHPQGGAPGRLALNASIGGVESPFSLGDLHVEADGGAESVDLRPYAGLLQKLGGLSPPEEAVTWTFKGSTQGGAIDATTSARAGSALSLDLKASLQPGETERKWTLAASGDASLELLQGAVGSAGGAAGTPGSDGTKAAKKTDEKTGKRIEAAGRLRLTGLDLAGAVPSVPSSPAFKERLVRSLEGGGRIELAGRIARDGWAVERGSAELRAKDGRVSIEKIEGVLNGGKASGAAAVDLGEEPPRYSGTVRLEDVAANYEMTPLLAYVIPFVSLEGERAVFNGKIHGSLELEGRGLDRAALDKDIGGKGSLRVREGSISASSFFAEAADLLGLDLGEVGFTEIGSDFTLLPGRVECGNVFFNGKPGAKIRNLGLKGVSRFDGSIEFGVDVSGLRETVGDKKIRKALEGIEKVLGDGMLPIKLAGTLRSPKLALDVPAAGGVLERVLGGGDGKGGAGSAGGEAAPAEGLPVDEILDLFKRKKKRKKTDEKKTEGPEK